MLAQKLSQVRLVRSEENVTGRGGLPWIYQCLEHFGIKQMVDKKFRAKKSNRQKSAWEKIMAGALTVMSGGDRVEDINVLRSDPTLIKGLGWDGMVSPDTFLGFLRLKVTGTKIQQINEAIGIEAMKRSSLSEFTYDNDATYFNCEKKCATYSYQKEKQMSGLLGHIPELSGLCVTMDLRPGNISPASGILEQLKTAVSLAKKAKKVITNFRSDSAAHNQDIFTFCEEENINYFVTLDKNKVICESIAQIHKKDWIQLPDRKDVDYAEFMYAMAKNKKEVISMRALVLRWPNPDITLFDQTPYCYHVIATNNMEIDPLHWLDFHNKRMNSENYHKELKSGFAGAYMPSHKFQKNRSFFMINIFAYNAIQMIKLFYFDNPELNWTIKTIRFRFINTCIRFSNHARSTVCRVINVSNETFSLYKAIWQKIQIA